MNESTTDIQSDLHQSLNLYRELLKVVETENHALRQAGPEATFQPCGARKLLLPRLNSSLDRLRQHRAAWTRLTPGERNSQSDIGGLLRQCQDTIMRVLVLDRENEQAFLRLGLLAPRHLPSHQAQRPHFVADLYQRRGGG